MFGQPARYVGVAFVVIVVLGSLSGLTTFDEGAEAVLGSGERETGPGNISLVDDSGETYHYDIDPMMIQEDFSDDGQLNVPFPDKGERSINAEEAGIFSEDFGVFIIPEDGDRTEGIEVEYSSIPIEGNSSTMSRAERILF